MCLHLFRNDKIFGTVTSLTSGPQMTKFDMELSRYPPS